MRSLRKIFLRFRGAKIAEETHCDSFQIVPNRHVWRPLYNIWTHMRAHGSTWMSVVHFDRMIILLYFLDL